MLLAVVRQTLRREPEGAVAMQVQEARPGSIFSGPEMTSGFDWLSVLDGLVEGRPRATEA